MWLLFGVAAIIAAMINVVLAIKGKEAKWFRFLSLSMTALTICGEYALIERWVLREDWRALIDVVPGMGKYLYFLVISSILINGISLFEDIDKYWKYLIDKLTAK